MTELDFIAQQLKDDIISPIVQDMGDRSTCSLFYDNMKVGLSEGNYFSHPMFLIQ